VCVQQDEEYARRLQVQEEEQLRREEEELANFLLPVSSLSAQRYNYIK
jgi:hypothetical protein